MAQSYEDFSGYNVGDDPIALGDWEVINGTIPTSTIGQFGGGSKYFELFGENDGRQSVRRVGGLESTTDKVEVYALLTGTGFKPTHGVEILSGNQNGYSYRNGSRSGEIKFVRLDNNSETDIASVAPESLGFRVLMRAENGALKVKCWSTGDPEPTDWDIETTDTTHAAVFAAIAVKFRGVRVVSYGVGTDGDPAPRAPVAAVTEGDWASAEATTTDGLGTWASTETTTEVGIGTWSDVEAATTDGIGSWASTEATTTDGIGAWTSTETTTDVGIGSWASVETTTESGIGAWANTEVTTESGIGAWASVEATTTAQPDPLQLFLDPNAYSVGDTVPAFVPLPGTTASVVVGEDADGQYFDVKNNGNYRIAGISASADIDVFARMKMGVFANTNFRLFADIDDTAQGSANTRVESGVSGSISPSVAVSATGGTTVSADKAGLGDGVVTIVRSIYDGSSISGLYALPGAEGDPPDVSTPAADASGTATVTVTSNSVKVYALGIGLHGAAAPLEAEVTEGAWSNTEATTAAGVGVWASTEVTTNTGVGEWAGVEATTEDGIGVWSSAEATTLTFEGADGLDIGIQHYIKAEQLPPLDIIKQNFGTDRGATLTEDGIRNHAFTFDGAGFVSLGHRGEDVGGLHATSGRSWSVRVWAKVADGDTGTVIARAAAAGGSARNFQLYFNSSGTPGIILRGATTIPPVSLRDGQWHQHVITWDGTTALYYADTSSPTTLNVGTSTEPQNEPIILGARRSGTSFRLTGAVDEIALYDRALTASEVQALYSGGDALTFPIPEEGTGQWASTKTATPDIRRRYFFDPNDYDVGTDASGLPFTQEWQEGATGQVFEIRDDEDGKGHYLYIENPSSGDAFWQYDDVPAVKDAEIYVRKAPFTLSGVRVKFWARWVGNDTGYLTSGSARAWSSVDGDLSIVATRSGVSDPDQLRTSARGTSPTTVSLSGWEEDEGIKLSGTGTDTTTPLQQKGTVGISVSAAIQTKVYGFGVGILGTEAPKEKQAIPGYTKVAMATALSDIGDRVQVEIHRRGDVVQPVIETTLGADGPTISYEGSITGGVVRSTASLAVLDTQEGQIYDMVADALDDEYRVRILRDVSTDIGFTTTNTILTEAWQGQLLSDSVQRATREGGRFMLQIEAKTQTSKLDSASSGLTGRHSLAAVLQDSIETVAALPVETATTWRPFASPPMQQDAMWAVERDIDHLTGREDKPLSKGTIAEDTAKLLASRLLQWNGTWKVYQPAVLSPNTIWTDTDETRTEDHTIPFSQVEIERGGIERARPAARQQSVRYAHGARQGFLLQNREFNLPIQDPATGDGEGNWKPSSMGVTQLVSGGKVRVDMTPIETDETTPPLQNIRQSGGSVIGGPDRYLIYGYAAALRPSGDVRVTAQHKLFYTLQVGSYFWNNTDKVWQQGAHFNPRTFSIIQGDVSLPLQATDPLVDDTNTPISGQLQVRLYGGWSEVDSTVDVDPWYVEYDAFDIEIDTEGADGEETEARLVTVGVQDETAGVALDEVQLLSGTGPTDLHPARLTVAADGSTADGWKTGSYAAGETTTAVSHAQHWATQALQIRRPAQRLYEETWHLPADIPLSPLYVMDRGGVPCHWERLTLDFQRHTMEGLWVQMHPVDEDLPVGFAIEDITEETGVVEKRGAGVVSFPAIQGLDERAGVYIKGPMGIDQRLWALPVQKEMQTAFPFADGKALDHDGQARTIAILLNGTGIGTLNISSGSGSVSSTVPSGTPVPAGSLITLVGPDTAFDGDISLALNFTVAL